MRTQLLFLTGTMFLVGSAIAQAPGSAELDINDVRALFLSDGRIGNDPLTGAAAFEVPMGSGTHPLYVAAPWIGGLDQNNQLNVAALTYGTDGFDFWPGPLGTNASITAATSAQWNHVFSITRAEVNAFIAGGPITTNIADWPAHGDVLLGQDLYLAPFVDVDLDGIYDPVQGDHPCFPGDQAVFYIFNDQKVHDETGGDVLGVEYRAMAFAYNGASGALDQTVFLHYTIKNQGSQTLVDSYTGLFADFDLGNAQDDLLGTDAAKGLLYVMNGDDTDETTASQGYGTQPPAFGIALMQGPHMDSDGMDDPIANNSLPALNGTGFGDGVIDNERLGLTRTMYYNAGFGAQGDPVTAAEHYDYLTGKWNDGSSLLYGGTGHVSSGGANPNQPSAFMYPDASDPFGAGTGGNVQAGWSEITAGNMPGDRRATMSSGPFTIQPGEYIGMDMAFIFARATTGGPMASVQALQVRTDSIRDFFFTNGLFSGPVDGGCSAMMPLLVTETLGIGLEASLHPIPASDAINLSITGNTGRASITIHDLTGKLIARHTFSGATVQLSITELESGIYLLSIETERGSEVLRFVKE